LLHAFYCEQNEHTSKILLSRGKKFVPIYSVQLYTKRKHKWISIPMRTAKYRTF